LSRISESPGGTGSLTTSRELLSGLPAPYLVVLDEPVGPSEYHQSTISFLFSAVRIHLG